MSFKNVRLWIATAAVVVAAGAATSAFAQNIAVVNGKPIPKERVDALVAELVRQGQTDSPQLQTAVREELVNREIMMQEAEKQGIPNQPSVKVQMGLASQSVAIRALITNYMKTNAPTDAELHAKYDAAVKQAQGKEYHLHHILVADEKQAKDIIAKLKGGAKFEDMAKQFSTDKGSAEHGGDLDWANLQTYVPEFGAAAKNLQKGQITDTPVHSQFGWHIIRLDDTRDVKVPSFDEVKPQLTQQMQQEKLQAYEQSLRAKAKIQ
jgi:peptidyl-prolyl cis-trans isomerase C